jgi:transcriptional regulator with XRE-family HTH domain
MPRPNPLRSIGGERNLARRIERERIARGLSYDALARRLTAAGCNIVGSAIYKIEKADPPRRITVDELVTLARVFETTVEDLLTPIEVLRNQRAQQLLKDLEQGEASLLGVVGQLVRSYSELMGLTDTDPEIYKLVAAGGTHAFNPESSKLMVYDTDEPLVPITDETGKQLDVDESVLRAAYDKFTLVLMEHAGIVGFAQREAARHRDVEAAHDQH